MQTRRRDVKGAHLLLKVGLMDAGKRLDDDSDAAEVARLEGGMLAATALTVVVISDDNPLDAGGLVTAGHFRHTLELTVGDVIDLQSTTRCAYCPHAQHHGVAITTRTAAVLPVCTAILKQGNKSCAPFMGVMPLRARFKSTRSRTQQRYSPLLLHAHGTPILPNPCIVAHPAWAVTGLDLTQHSAVHQSVGAACCHTSSFSPERFEMSVDTSVDACEPADLEAVTARTTTVVHKRGRQGWTGAYRVGGVVFSVDGADEHVVGDVVEVATEFEPGACHGDVVGRALALGLDEHLHAPPRLSTSAVPPCHTHASLHVYSVRADLRLRLHEAGMPYGNWPAAGMQVKLMILLASHERQERSRSCNKYNSTCCAGTGGQHPGCATF